MNADREVEALSPNHGPRRRVKFPRAIILHADASPNEQATLDWIRRPESQVSYHLLVGRRGTLYRCVPDNRRAWANGHSELVLDGVRYTDVNDVSLSVAFANRHDGKELLTPQQLVTGQLVVQRLMARWPTITTVTTHAQIARPLGRKSDPERAPNFRLTDFFGKP